MSDSGAGVLPPRFSTQALWRDARTAINIVDTIRADLPGLDGWINFPLLNQSGQGGDLRLEAYTGRSRPTEYANDLPMTMTIVRELGRAGFDFRYARIAVLPGRDVLRPHVDMYAATRLIVALNEQGDDFRHVFDDVAVAMRAGEVWAVEGSRCHGAANVSRSGTRVALLLDAQLGSGPADWAAPWQIQPDRRLHRPLWTAGTREARRELFRQLAAAHGWEAAEKEWHFLAFEFDIRPHDAYAELIALYEDLSSAAQAPQRRRFLRARAGHWSRHNCVCVDEPELGTQQLNP